MLRCCDVEMWEKLRDIKRSNVADLRLNLTAGLPVAAMAKICYRVRMKAITHMPIVNDCIYVILQKDDVK